MVFCVWIEGVSRRRERRTAGSTPKTDGGPTFEPSPWKGQGQHTEEKLPPLEPGEVSVECMTGRPRHSTQTSDLAVQDNEVFGLRAVERGTDSVEVPLQIYPLPSVSSERFIRDVAASGGVVDSAVIPVEGLFDPWRLGGGLRRERRTARSIPKTLLEGGRLSPAMFPLEGQGQHTEEKLPPSEPGEVSRM